MAHNISKIYTSLILHKQIIKQNTEFPKVVNYKFLLNCKFTFLRLSKMTVINP